MNITYVKKQAFMKQTNARRVKLFNIQYNAIEMLHFAQ